MEIIGIIIIRYFFAVLGAFLRFIFQNLILILKRKKTISFGSIWSGKGKLYDHIENDTANVILGLIVFIIFATLVVKNNW
mgnify:CR=1 FL=1